MPVIRPDKPREQAHWFTYSDKADGVCQAQGCSSTGTVGIAVYLHGWHVVTSHLCDRCGRVFCETNGLRP